MSKSKKLTLLLSGGALLITLGGSLLQGLGPIALQEVGAVVHGGGQALMLLGLTAFLALNIIERTQRSSRGAALAKGDWMIVASQVTAVILMVLGLLLLGQTMLGVLTAGLRPRGFFIGLSNGFVTSLVTLASGMALWLIAHIAQRVNLLLDRSFDDDSRRET